MMKCIVYLILLLSIVITSYAEEEEELNYDIKLRGLNSYERNLSLLDEYYDVASNVWFHITQDSWINAIEKRVYIVGSDKAKVDLIDNVCYITAKETDETADWIGNMDLGHENIISTKLTSQRDSSCGCEMRLWYWPLKCQRYKRCSFYKKVGSGYDGFVKAANKLRLNIKDEVNAHCSSAEKFVFGGYSRGGGICQVLAYIFLKDGLVQASKTSLVTFGSPRSLRDGEAEWLHRTLPESIRIVYKDDPACAVPYHWMGYKHVGRTRVCNQCSYSLDLDRPKNFNPKYLSSHSILNYSNHIFEGSN